MGATGIEPMISTVSRQRSFFLARLNNRVVPKKRPGQTERALRNYGPPTLRSMRPPWQISPPVFLLWQSEIIRNFHSIIGERSEGNISICQVLVTFRVFFRQTQNLPGSLPVRFKSLSSIFFRLAGDNINSFQEKIGLKVSNFPQNRKASAEFGV